MGHTALAISAQSALELPHRLQLAVVVVGARPEFGVLNAVEGIKTKRLPELVAAGAGHFLGRFLLEVGEAPLQVLDLGNRHRQQRSRLFL